jgi:hypothetical protein
VLIVARGTSASIRRIQFSVSGLDLPCLIAGHSVKMTVRA